mmetsp:Transcript_6841/g.16349  ORF Transcript_6841/g.16349 Transcript_6841/m.16349 type:complete len:169 (-) Transcript_6841:189-695(-)
MVVARLRFVFGAWPEGGEPNEPNALQLTSIKQGPRGEVLGNHFDHRDRWGNWIATVAWARDMTHPELAKEGGGGVGGTQEPRGEWTLVMKKENTTVEIPCGPGTAYTIEGNAQGSAESNCCLEGATAHEACRCCSTHGVTPDKSMCFRQSMTIRRFVENWGRKDGPGL